MNDVIVILIVCLCVCLAGWIMTRRIFWVICLYVAMVVCLIGVVTSVFTLNIVGLAAFLVVGWFLLRLGLILNI